MRLVWASLQGKETLCGLQHEYLWPPVQPVLNGVLLINQNSIWQTNKNGELSDSINTVFHCLYQAGKTATGNECVRQLDTSYLFTYSWIAPTQNPFNTAIACSNNLSHKWLIKEDLHLCTDLETLG